MNALSWVRLLTAAAVAAFGSAGPRAAVAADPAPREVWLRGAGATFPAPLYKAWIKAYEAEHGDITLTYDAIGSGAGLSQFVTGSVDFAGSDAPIGDADIAKVERGVVSVPATAGMVVLAYSLPDGVGPLRLSREAYAGIFAGEITEWDDPRIQVANPDVKLPNTNIAVVTRRDASGTTFAFTSHLNAISPLWRQKSIGAGTLVSWPGGAMKVPGNEGVAQRIKISAGAIGYVEYGFAKRLGLPVAALENREGNYVMPTEEAGTQALAEAAGAMDERLRVAIPDAPGESAYPIVTYSWLLLYGSYPDAKKAAAIRDFVAWGLREGQTLREEGLSGYIPLPANVAAKGQQALATIR
ncbi:MAG: phosphate ABC transporter substrate-binding protein PstS [Rhodospirillales bacterium]